MLLIEGLAASYGQSQALAAVELELRAGEVVTLLGRNGMGKTTTVRAIMGLLPSQGGRQHAGRIAFEGRDIAGLPPYAIARLGLGLVPEGRQVFPTLTVEENLIATAAHRGPGAPRWTLPAIYALFPRLEERRGNAGRNLSGGEQQMLAIGRALMTNPRLLLLDEATEGLAPLIRAEIWGVLGRLKAEGQAILLIDKNLSAVLALADRHVIIEKGRTMWSGDSAALIAAPEIKERYLHV
jgi:branched-chain amino acid transport system ATP-binding protein